MGVHHRLTLVALCAAVAIVGCKDKRKDEERRAPVDHLAAGELPLGPDKVFALPLPKGAQISNQYGREIIVSTQFTPEVLANFVRYHVKGGKVTVGAGATQFEDVYVTEEPSRFLSIDVRAAVVRGGSIMVVRDRTAGDPKLPPSEQFKAIGLTPDGKLADPKHME